MKNITFILGLLFSLPLMAEDSYSPDLLKILVQLDRLVDRREELHRMKEQRIENLRGQIQK